MYCIILICIYNYYINNANGVIKMSDMYKTGEIYKVMENFEKSFKGRGRLDREKDKEWWMRGQWYENGETNLAFTHFFNGYSMARSLALMGEWA